MKRRRLFFAGIALMSCTGVWAQTGYRDGESVLGMLQPVVEAAHALDLQRAAAYGSGFVRTGDTFVCDAGDTVTQKLGVVFSILLNQREALPVRAVAEAFAEKVAGETSADFSLYLDIAYCDGGYLYGQTASFAPDAALGWQTRDVLVIPERPIKSINYYLLFRNRAGRVQFRRPVFNELSLDQASTFDTFAVTKKAALQEGFLVRDVAAAGDFTGLAREACGIRLATHVQQGAGYKTIDVTVSDLTGRDRALTLYYTLPVPAHALTWFPDLRTQQDITSARAEKMVVSQQEIGANGLLSRYPFTAVSAEGRGVAIGLDPATPLVYRVAVQPALRTLYFAGDIGLSPEKPTARFRLCLFDFEAQHGLRGAFARYYALYPEAFATRIQEQGQWMAFAPISKVEQFEDFGFRFKEGVDEPAFDDAHNILSFRYTEPMTWWMRLDGKGMRTLVQGVDEVRRLAQAGNPSAQAWLSSAFHDERGDAPGRILDTPWCNGVVWSMNCAPGVTGTVTDFTTRWPSNYVQKTYGKPRGQGIGVDGEYIDSAEAYVTATLNFRRSHFAGAERPLCYALRSRKVGLYKGMIGFEYVRKLAEDTHAKGYYMMANSTPHAWFWLAPLLDVMGTETNWKHSQRFTPMDDATLLYIRALCKGKPFCFLMNTDFTQWTYADSEKFMRVCLAYGMFPGYFSANASTDHYFKNPAWYNRDRPLFKRYMPLCKRVAEAGWEPITGLQVAGGEKIRVERFGKSGGTQYITVYNAGDRTQCVQLVRNVAYLGASPTAQELLANAEYSWKNATLELTVAAGHVAVLECK